MKPQNRESMKTHAFHAKTAERSKPMKILHLLPELSEGGVERHVLDLTRGLAERGHTVGVISAGGKLVASLPPEVVHHVLPVHRKNLFTGAVSTLKLRSLVLREGWELLHAHSRVPFWIAWWTAFLTGIPWVATAHALYSKNAGIYPLRRAAAAICVSKAVENYLEDFLPLRKEVVYNGLFSQKELEALKNTWQGPENPREKRLLFVGRLTKIKGFHVVLEALKGLDAYPWALDVLGEGPRGEDFLRKTEEEGWSDRVFFHGYRENPGEWMEKSSCLVFPSLQEGMGRVFLEALARGVPVFASRIPALEELVSSEDLLPPGNSEAWRGIFREFFEGTRKAPLPKLRCIPTREAMITASEALYKEILSS